MASIDKEVARVMDDIFWLALILSIIIVAAGTWVLRTRRLRRSEVGASVHCSRCETPMSARRIPLYKSHFELGNWKCPHCGARMDKSGKILSAATR
jgi:DNA-directed RNA polymerase subunit RPC12/RpoP